MLVVSRGDEQLVRLEAHRGWHFPRHEDGRFAGYHPQDSEAAIAHLEELRSNGAEYLVFPETSLWWLSYYGGLREHLESRYRLLAETESCLIYDVSGGAEVEGGGAVSSESQQSATTAVDDIVGRLLPPESTIAVLSADAAGAAEIDRLSDEGVEFLVVPSTEFTLLDMQPALRNHLRTRHRFVTRQRHICEIYELSSE